MYVLVVRVKVLLQKEREFLQTIRCLQRDQESENGGANLTLYADRENRSGYRLIQKWKTERELMNYLSGQEFGILLGALQILCEKSVIKYRRFPKSLFANTLSREHLCSVAV